MTAPFDITRQRLDLLHEESKALRRTLVLIDAGEFTHAQDMFRASHAFRAAIDALETGRRVA